MASPETLVQIQNLYFHTNVSLFISPLAKLPTGSALVNKTATKAKYRTFYTTSDPLVQIQNNYTKTLLTDQIYNTPYSLYWSI